MPNIVTFLKRLIGRVRKHMDTFFMTMGGIFIPLGFAAMAVGKSLSILFFCGVAAVVVGLVAWFKAYNIAQERETKQWADREQDKRNEQNRWEETQRLLTNIHKELQRFNEEKK
jgi:hypothetical protein